MRLALLSLLLLVGCATAPLEPQNETLPPNEGRIYFLRDSGGLYPLRSPDVKVNGRAVGSIAAGSSFFVDRQPGDYYITVETWDSPGRFAATLRVRAGKVYYMQVSPRSESLMPGVALGLVGLYADSKVNDNSGLFGLTALDERAGRILLSRVGK